MSLVAGAITALLELNSSRFDDAVAKATDATRKLKTEIDGLDQPSKKAQSDLDAIADAAAEIGPAAETASAASTVAMGAMAVAAAAVAVAVYSIVEAYKGIKEVLTDVLTRQDSIGDMAANIGIGADELSRVGFAAEQAGSNVQEAADAFKFLGKNVYDAVNGNKEAAANFSKFGIEIRDAAGNARPLGDVMNDVADAIQNAAPGAQRTGAAMDLLSARSTNLIAALSAGSAGLREAATLSDYYGYTVSKTAAAAADHFGDMLGELRGFWEGVKSVFGEKLIEQFTPVLENMLQWIQTHMPEIRDIVERTATTIARTLESLINVVESLSGILDTKLGQVLIGGAIGGALFGPIGAGIGAYSGLTADDSHPAGVVNHINVQPIDTRASTTQIHTAIQQGLRSAQRDRDRMDVEIARTAAQAGL